MVFGFGKKKKSMPMKRKSKKTITVIDDSGIKTKHTPESAKYIAKGSRAEGYRTMRAGNTLFLDLSKPKRRTSKRKQSAKKRTSRRSPYRYSRF